MSSISEIVKRHGRASQLDLEWINLLVADWQLIADLVFADLVLWVPTAEGDFVAVSHARPSSAATVFYRDITGELVRKHWATAVKEAFKTGKLVSKGSAESYQSTLTAFSAIPVKRRVSKSSDAVTDAPIAVITQHTNLAEAKAPNKLQLNYLNCGKDLLQMVADGAYPDFGNSTGPKRGAPRANDGLLRLDVNGIVTFASPNGLSAFNRFGAVGELEGVSLIKATTPVLKSQLKTDQSLPVLLSGQAAWRADLESRNLALSVRAIPLKAHGERIGAIVLCRDVTELRSQERELITKDATIREIHHRVKNNLQTVASLLRIQSRRSESEETKSALAQAMRRVSSIAVVHDTLATGLNQEVNFDEVFDRILLMVSELASAHGQNVKTIIDGKFGMLQADQSTPLAMSLTELVTNAIEHGLADRNGVVHITAERRQMKLEIVVSDNGKGIKPDRIGAGLGTQIVKTLIEGELRGSIHWSSPKEGGARVAITIPL